jgi:hypothetical protein
VLAGRTETWTNPWPGFIEDVLYAACGAVPFHEGAWRFFDTTVCCAMQYCVCPADEEGWHRWRLPSPDGIVRPDDWSAPWITRSPSGSLFWCNGRDPKRELVKSLGALLDRCFELRAQVVRVAA